MVMSWVGGGDGTKEGCHGFFFLNVGYFPFFPAKKTNKDARDTI